jgi:hypothetical protein
MEDKYTRLKFEKEFSKNKNRIILRNGCFVGLYKYDKNNNQLILTKPIIDNDYGKYVIYSVKESGRYWGSGGFEGLTSIIECNEAHFIPEGYTLSMKQHLMLLDSCEVVLGFLKQ